MRLLPWKVLTLNVILIDIHRVFADERMDIIKMYIDMTYVQRGAQPRSTVSSLSVKRYEPGNKIGRSTTCEKTKSVVDIIFQPLEVVYETMG